MGVRNSICYDTEVRGNLQVGHHQPSSAQPRISWCSKMLFIGMMIGMCVLLEYVTRRLDRQKALEHSSHTIR